MKTFIAFCFAFFCFAAPAFADFGDIAVGGNLGVGYTEVNNGSGPPPEGIDTWIFANPQFAFRLGLLDWLHLDIALGTFISDISFNPNISLGFTGAIDVWTIVPEFTLGGFAVMGDGGQGIGGGLRTALALRYHLDPKWSVAVGGELNLGLPSWFQGTASFLYVVD